MPRCRHCEIETDIEHHDRVVHNKTPLHGPWAGWRMAGKDLVAPDGSRISPTRMRGIMFRMDAEERLQRARARRDKANAVRRQLVKVVVVDLGDWKRRHFGTSAA